MAIDETDFANRRWFKERWKNSGAAGPEAHICNKIGD